MTDRVAIRIGEYHDSVRLMQASRELQHMVGIEHVQVAMGTELNRRLVIEAGFEPRTLAGAGPNDLIVAMRGTDEALTTALESLDSFLTPKITAEPGPSSTPPAHVVGSMAGNANLALVSVPGQWAFVEAMDALRHGMHVMVFSNNVSVEHEVVLKQTAEKLDLLVMGPDCGTALIGGAGLGFANAVSPGPVGIVGAAGTGIQQVCCLLDEAGIGVRHAIGTGSRDLTAEVGGSSTLRGLAALDGAPDIDVIIVVSKPPEPGVAEAVERAAAACSKPVVLAMLGEEGVTLEGAARAALRHLGSGAATFHSWPAPEGHRRGFLRGLFSGGSLCSEARMIAASLGPIGHDEDSWGHTLVDYGDDRYTQGRPHPMIDLRVRLHRLEAAALDPAVGVILLDVVLGYGAHPDPASELAPMIDIARAEGPSVVVSLCGTAADPQDRSRQARMLNDAGASVWTSNAQAARHGVALVKEAARD